MTFHVPAHLSVLSLSKLLGAFSPGVIVFAVGAEGVAQNPLTINDVALMLAGISLVWFGGAMIKTLRAVDNILPRLLALEQSEQARVNAILLADAMRTAKEHTT